MSDAWKDDRIAELYTQLAEYRKLCEWEWKDGRWQTACGSLQLEGNNFKHCPNCGRKFRLNGKPEGKVVMVQPNLFDVKGEGE